MGDTSDLDRLVLDHLPSALRLAVRLTGDRDAAEELVQEALLRVAKRWRTFRGESTFRTWLFRILINVFRDWLRRRTLTVIGLDDETLDVRTAQPHEAALADELAALVAAEVSRLPPRQREVLVLIAFERLSTSETAAIVGISEQNVHATLSAARARLKQRLAPYLGYAEK